MLRNYEANFDGVRVYVPDFLRKADMDLWWGQQLEKLVKNVLKLDSIDGFILAHNSPKLENASNCDFAGQLAFAPTRSNGQNLLANQTICPTAMHFNGLKHIKMHNDFAKGHAEATNNTFPDASLYSFSSSPGLQDFVYSG